MNEKTMEHLTAPAPKQPKTPSEPARTPIRVDKLLIAHSNPNGIRLPDGSEGKSDKMQHTVEAGEKSDIKTEIDFRPWLRMYRVAKSRKVTRTVGDKEVASWAPMGKPFFIPEAWAVCVLADDQ